MKFFSRKTKQNARIIIGGITVEFNRENEWWSFEFEGSDFICYGVELKMPSETELRKVVAQIERIESDMKSRINQGLDELGCRTEEDTWEYTINIENLFKERFITVSWSDDKWGDVGVDFEINEKGIISETWGD